MCQFVNVGNIIVHKGFKKFWLCRKIHGKLSRKGNSVNCIVLFPSILLCRGGFWESIFSNDGTFRKIGILLYSQNGIDDDENDNECADDDAKMMMIMMMTKKMMMMIMIIIIIMEVIARYKVKCDKCSLQLEHLTIMI